MPAALALVGACADGDTTAPLAHTTGPDGPAFFDAYQDAASAATVTRGTPTGTVAEVEAKRGTPRFVWGSHSATPPASALVPSVSTRSRAPSKAAAAALWHLRQNAEAYGLSPEALGSVEVALVHDTGSGPIVVRLKQRVGGLEVYRTQLAVVMNRDFSLVALSGDLHPEAKSSKSAAFAFGISETAALNAAVADVTGSGPDFLAPAGTKAGYDLFGAPGLARPANVKKVLFPLPDRLVPAYVSEVAIADGNSSHGFRHVFSADDGRLLYRQSIDSDATFQYRLWADPTSKKPLDGPLADSTPHATGTPDNSFPAFTTPGLVSNDGFNHPAGGGAGDPWIAASATESRGNNADAYADISAPDGFSTGDLRATTTAAQRFDRTYNTAANPDSSQDQIRASVASLFYVNNWLHDYWYDSGFNEAAGNAQASNFGRGGVEGDPVRAEAQDNSGTNNANMQVPADGTSPIMQMYRFVSNSGRGQADGTIDNMIVSHEWGHYLHHRLVSCGTQMCGGMSEGWADFVALQMILNEGDNTAGTFAMGAYATNTIYANAAYFGIRRYPYSTDRQKSPLTFKFIRVGEAHPGGIAENPFPPFQQAGNWEVHNAGEIWAGALFEGLAALVGESRGPSPRYSFEQAKRRMADYVVAGMIAAPVEPTFTQQRDSILAAAAAADPRDFVVLAQAFARRGLGSGAISPPTSTTNGGPVTESFTVTGMLSFDSITLAEGDDSCDHDGILDAGETGVITVRVKNAGAGALSATTARVTAVTPGVTFPGGNMVSLPAMDALASGTATFTVRLPATNPPRRIEIDVQLNDTGAAIPTVTRRFAAGTNVDVTPNASRTDDVEAPTPVWTTTGADGWQAKFSTQAASTVWIIPDIPAISDNSVASPAIQVAASGNFTIAFRHRYQFEASQFMGALTYWDGGVLEISRDNGATWQDVSMYANPGYTGTITTISGNPIGGRQAWSQQNAGYPNFVNVNLNLGTALAGQTVKIRFRAATDQSDGLAGWEVDDITVGGVTNNPFPTTTTDDGSCASGQPPSAVAGADQTVHSGDTVTLDGSGSSDPENTALTYAWTQASGPTVTLTGATTVHPTFVAPDVAQPTDVTVRLVVTDASSMSSQPDTVVVHVLPIEVEPDAGTPDGGTPDGGTEPDGGTTEPDGGTTEPDGGTQQPDSGTPGDDDGGGGGGCCSTSRDSAGSGLALAFVTGLVLVRRRRRR